MYSSSLDRFLLWAERGRTPDVTFIHNKYPDEAYHGGDPAALETPMTLSTFRLDAASACMGSGYVGKGIGRVSGGASPSLADYPGKAEQREKYGVPLPPDYDEYHAGTETVRGWLGLPVSGPIRIDEHLGPVLYRFDGQAALPSIQVRRDDWRAGPAERSGANGFRVRVEEVGLWRSRRDSFSLAAELPLPGIPFRQYEEYTLTFRVRGSSPFRHLDPAYAEIPRNITVRLVVDGQLGERSKVAYAGFIQEALVFEEERTVTLTLIAPADGAGKLEICLSENRGDLVFSDLTLRKGCADVMARRFENGLVLLNGSTFDPVTVSVSSVAPGESFRRLEGRQDPDHNTGAPVGDGLQIPAQDAVFLRSE